MQNDDVTLHHSIALSLSDSRCDVTLHHSIALSLSDSRCVRPQYDPTFGDAFWNSSEESFGQYVLTLLTNWALVCDVWYLPPMERQVTKSSDLYFTLNLTSSSNHDMDCARDQRLAQPRRQLNGYLFTYSVIYLMYLIICLLID